MKVGAGYQNKKTATLVLRSRSFIYFIDIFILLFGSVLASRKQQRNREKNYHNTLFHRSPSPTKCMTSLIQNVYEKKERFF